MCHDREKKGSKSKSAFIHTGRDETEGRGAGEAGGKAGGRMCVNMSCHGREEKRKGGRALGIDVIVRD